MRKNEKGSASIEAIVSFTAFIFLIFTILGVVNYCRVQSFISTAVDNTAKELSEYSYFYKMSGLNKINNAVEGNNDRATKTINDSVTTLDGLFTAFSNVENNAQGAANNIQGAIEGDEGQINNLKDTIDNLSTNVNDINTASNQVMQALGDIQDNPVQYMKCLAALAGGEAFETAKSHLIAAPLAKAFTTKHFGDTRDEADQALKDMGVVDGLDGMNFKLSKIFSYPNTDEIRIVVYYKVKLFDLLGADIGQVTLCKEAVVRAWLSGDAEINPGETQSTPTQATEPATTLWELYETDRGKEITRLEKEILKGGGYSTYLRNYDAFMPGSNEFVQIHSIDVFADSYINNNSSIKSQLRSYLRDFDKVVSGLNNKIPAYDGNGNLQEYDSNPSTRKQKMIFVLPEGASLDQSVIDQLKSEFPNVTIDVKKGYGRSTHEPEG